MWELTPEAIKARASTYLDERSRLAGSPFPIKGLARELVVAAMAAFACNEIIEALNRIPE